MSARVVNIGLLGYGTVGSALHRLLQTQGDYLRQTLGLEPRIGAVLVRDVAKAQRTFADLDLPSPPPRFVADPQDVVGNGAQVIVETIGGVEPARTLLGQALSKGKHVVTANKKLLAEAYGELAAAATGGGARLAFEASVCGAVPVIRTLRDLVRTQPIRQITGIVNGTTNYILSRMTEHRQSIDAALLDAQSRGLAERDPSADLDAVDAAEKISILSGLAFGQAPAAADILRRGIRNVTALDVEMARSAGFVIKLIATARRDEHGALDVRVLPALLERTHPLSRVADEQNAVLIHTDASGPLLLQGTGAGGLPTAGALLSDILDVVQHRGGEPGALWARATRAAESPADAYYVRTALEPGTNALRTYERAVRASQLPVRSLSVIRASALGSRDQTIFLTRPCAFAAVARFLEETYAVEQAFVARVQTERAWTPWVPSLVVPAPRRATGVSTCPWRSSRDSPVLNGS